MADVGADDGLGAERAQLLSEFGMMSPWRPETTI
jgi:hypothetical protein